jgi:hypothetical protein
MAARPNALRTLEYGKRLVDNQLKRLGEMILMADKVLQESKTLTADDVAGYKACISTAKKQVAILSKLTDIPLPNIAEAPARKRGRPSKSELTQLAVARGEKPAKLIAKAIKAAMAAPSILPTVMPATPVPKKRGRKSNATIAAEAAAAAALAAAPVPKKRGRPAKVKTETVEVSAPVASKVVQGPPAKKRGRPAKVKSDEAVEVVQAATDAPKRATRKPKSATPAINVAPITEGEPVKRGPGRPKGSKNAPKLLNGQHTEIISVN